MFAVIAQDPVSLIRAIKVDADSVEKAMDRCATLMTEEFQVSIHLLVNLDTAEISRIYWTEDGFKTHPSAYNHLGKYTDKEFFENETRDNQ
jgi:hypothetical protein